MPIFKIRIPLQKYKHLPIADPAFSEEEIAELLKNNVREYEIEIEAKTWGDAVDEAAHLTSNDKHDEDADS